jgi:ATP-binding cassette subfamily F protein 3
VEREAAGGITAEDSITAGNGDTAIGMQPFGNGPEPTEAALLPAEEAPKTAAGTSLPKTILLKASRPFKASELRELSKQRQTLIRRLEREEREILKQLEALEAEKAALETELGRPEVYSNGEKARAVKARLDGVTAELEGKGREWEEAAAELERVKGGE